MSAFEFVVTDPWWDLRGGGEVEAGQRDFLVRELRLEVKPGHELWGVDAVALARCGHCDDVLFQVGDRLAIVHLTYNRNERLPWPVTQWYDTAAEAETATAIHGE